MLLQRKRLIARMHQTINASRVFVVFCKPILAILFQTKRLIARMHLAAVFCKPILATWLHRKRLLARMHLECLLCKPILAMFLQRKPQTIINASRMFVDRMFVV